MALTLTDRLYADMQRRYSPGGFMRRVALVRAGVVPRRVYLNWRDCLPPSQSWARKRLDSSPCPPVSATESRVTVLREAAAHPDVSMEDLLSNVVVRGAQDYTVVGMILARIYIDNGAAPELDPRVDMWREHFYLPQIRDLGSAVQEVPVVAGLRITDALGDDLEAWNLAQHLMDDWTENLELLLETVRSLQ